MKALLVLVLLALLSLHVHLLLLRPDRIEPAPVIDTGARPIVLEEATLRALVREEVARALGPTGLTMPDLDAIRRSATAAVREGVADSRIREAVASQYVAAYYDATAEIEAQEAQRLQAQRNFETIRNNLRRIASAAQQYMLDEGVPKVWFENVVGPSRYIEEIVSVAGEDYRSVFPVTTGTTRLVVTMADGTVVDYVF